MRNLEASGDRFSMPIQCLYCPEEVHEVRVHASDSYKVVLIFITVLLQIASLNRQSLDNGTAASKLTPGAHRIF